MVARGLCDDSWADSLCANRCRCWAHLAGLRLTPSPTARAAAAARAQVCVPLFDKVRIWVFEGRLEDANDEFFIVRSGDQVRSPREGGGRGRGACVLCVAGGAGGGGGGGCRRACCPLIRPQLRLSVAALPHACCGNAPPPHTPRVLHAQAAASPPRPAPCRSRPAPTPGRAPTASRRPSCHPSCHRCVRAWPPHCLRRACSRPVLARARVQQLLAGRPLPACCGVVPMPA